MKLIIFFVLVCILIYNVFKFRIPKGMTLFVGVPGSGKTTICARLKQLHDKSIKHKKHKFGNNYFCNVPIVGGQNIDPYKDFGVNLIEDGIICCDESGVVFNNRNYNKLYKDSNVVEFAKYYRHFGIKSFCLFSQGMDIDVTFVRLADRIAIVTKSILPYFIKVKYARKKVGIDDLTHQLVDMYYFTPLGTKLVFAPTCWKMFDTYSIPFELNKVQFPIFNSQNTVFVNSEDENN